MRLALPPSLRDSALSALTLATRYARRVDDTYSRFAVPVVGWLIAGFAPLVSFEAGGGQTSIEIVRYVAFQGLDRDLWNAAGTALVLIGALSASAMMIGLVLHSTAFLFKDKALTLLGVAVVLVGLILVVYASRPIASVTLFNLAAFPHIGWWLTLFHAACTLWLSSQWPTSVRTRPPPRQRHGRRKHSRLQRLR